MTPSWYDVLDVEEDATPAEIRTAWKAAIADLDPGDRRFRLANQAAEVLLDPDKRAAHDAQLAAEAGDAADTVEAPADEEKSEERSEKSGKTREADDKPPTHTSPTKPRNRRPKPVPAEPAADTGWGLPPAVLALAVAAVVLAVLTVVALVQGRDTTSAEESGLPTAQQVEDARGAAEAAVVPVLSYDYRSLPDDQAEARTYLTDDYAQEYDRFFAAAVETNAPRTKTVVRVRVLDSAIVRTGEDRVDVLLFVNRPTTNAQRSVEYRDQVTMRMLDVDGTWLVDCMITTGTGPCEGD